MPEFRDWSQLLTELLQKIAGNLTEITDHLRCRAVCSPWRRSLIPTDIPPQLPWLLLPSPSDPSKQSLDRRLFSLSERKHYTLRLPNSRYIQFFGSSHGYLLAYDDLSISLLNPFTGSRISLPPITPKDPKYTGKASVGNAMLVRSDSGSGFQVIISLYLWPCVFSSSVYSPISITMSWRSGEGAWREIDASPNCIGTNFIFYKERLFFIKDSGTSTGIFDPNDSNVGREIFSLQIPSVDHDKCYLVESPSSKELLLVVRDEIRERLGRFEVFQLKAENEWREAKWVKVTNIGHDVLFVDDSNAMCFDARNFSGCRGNCIYFWVWYPGRRSYVGRVCLFNIDECRVEQLGYGCYNFLNSAGSAVWVVPAA